MLKNSIGKDLSKMSLPIIFNEPLSALQRWCEDLEYAYLLDKAATAASDAVRHTESTAEARAGLGLTALCVSPLECVLPGAVQERMAFVSVFQISNYSSTMIRVYKPFNPILGETYECQRYVKARERDGDRAGRDRSQGGGEEHGQGRGRRVRERRTGKERTRPVERCRACTRLCVPRLTNVERASWMC